MTWHDHIVVDPATCHGKPCIKGTRVLVSVILDIIAAGETPGQISTTYRLAKEDVQAALQYADEQARERIVPLESGAAWCNSKLTRISRLNPLPSSAISGTMP